MVRRGSTVRVRQRTCTKVLANGHVALPAMARFRRFAGMRRVHVGLAGTRGHARRLAGYATTRASHSIEASDSESSCKQPIGVARAGATLTPPWREGVTSGRLQVQGGAARAGATLTPPWREGVTSGRLQVQGGARYESIRQANGLLGVESEGDSLVERQRQALRPGLREVSFLELSSDLPERLLVLLRRPGAARAELLV
jgi:hypothetical protein